MQKLLRFLLIFGAGYLVIDGLVHFLNLKLLDVTSWPKDALVYAQLLDLLYGSFSFLAAGVAYVLQKDLKKYQDFAFVVAIWSFFHSFILFYLGFSKDFVTVFSQTPSLYVWNLFYDQILLSESFLLFSFGLLILLWLKKTKNE